MENKNRDNRFAILGSLRKKHIKIIAESLQENKIEVKIEPAIDGKMFLLIVKLKDAKNVVKIASKCIQENNLEVEYMQNRFWIGYKKESNSNYEV